MTRLVTRGRGDPVGLRHSIRAELSTRRWVTADSFRIGKMDLFVTPVLMLNN